MKPRNLPEKLIWYYILSTYAIYYIGGLYLFAPLLALFLSLYLLRKWWLQTPYTPEEDRICLSLPAWVWLGCMVIVAIAAVVGGIGADLPYSKIAFTLVNRWFKTFALLALFPAIGHLDIRPQLIYRAICIFCIQSLILVAIFTLLSYVFDSYNYSYISPLAKFGGGTLYYNVKIFGAVIDVSEKRLQMIAPWPPALGLVGDIFFCLCMQEKDKKFKILGMAGAASLAISSVSRAAIVCLPLIPLLSWILSGLTNPWAMFIFSGSLFSGSIFFTEIKNAIDDFASKVKDYRGGSTKARDMLKQLALDGWKESPIWGHGTMSENGPASVGFRGIGSHQTWYGVLYAYGLVAAIPLAIAFLWSFFDLITKVGTHKHAVVGICILCVLLVFSTVDNIDTLAYLYWPGLIILGIAFKEKSIKSHEVKYAFYNP
ncbi:O-antigen ligase family protein [Altericista sp. CCNU0014]|uniref:O-antigen ligase family protein n=1 Tax=Altericista sp. CCNU0014 TaxID=3082949 RepID=UPI003850F621